ncbi:MAG: hypothetical protein ACPHK8_03030 [Thermoplasmatota archaeon]
MCPYKTLETITLTILFAGCIDETTGNQPPVHHPTDKIPGTPFVSLGECKHYSTFSQLPFELYAHLEEPEYPFYQSAGGLISLRIETYECKNEADGMNNYIFSLVQLIVEPTNLKSR